jgi:hypothetical protein
MTEVFTAFAVLPRAGRENVSCHTNGVCTRTSQEWIQLTLMATSLPRAHALCWRLTAICHIMDADKTTRGWSTHDNRGIGFQPVGSRNRSTDRLEAYPTPR